MRVALCLCAVSAMATVAGVTASSVTANPPIIKLVAHAVNAAARAGKIIREVMRRGELGIVEKGQDDLQTEADRAAQRCIMASLYSRFPTVTIIGEEGPSDLKVPDDWLITEGNEEVLKKQCPESLLNIKEEDIVVWVDPLDGTSEYTQGALVVNGGTWERLKSFIYHPFISAKWYLSLLHSNYGFLEHVTVLIGISVHEQPIGGIMHQPYWKGSSQNVTGRTIWGLQGYGVEGLPPIIQTNDSIPLIVTTSRSHSNPLAESCLEAIKPDKILRVGGAGYKVLQLLEGTATAYVFASSGCKKWDTCAPEAILRAAGGVLTDILGKPYKYGSNAPKPNHSGVLATSSPALHETLVSLIPNHVKEKLSQ